MHWLKTPAALAVLLAAGPMQLASAQQAIAPLPRPEHLTPAQATLADMVANAAGGTIYDDRASPEELDALVAPVALYPDALLAQILVAAAYPLQIVEADRLLAESDTMTDDELTRAMEDEDWDPSVLVLATGFPTVVSRMAGDLDWTERLGAAMLAQDEDVLAAVQRMRAEALDTGYLTSNAAQTVEERDEQIYIRPADPDVVYVPSYDPAMAFTSAPTAAPYIQPRDNLFANPLVTGAMAFGAGLLLSELFDDDDGGGNHKNDKNSKKDGWGRYWDEPQAIDWRDRQLYPRPQRAWYDADRYAWSRERDDAWDRSSHKWRPSRELIRAREAERQETLAHLRDDRARAARLDDLRRAAAEAREDADRQRERARKAQAAARQREQEQRQPATREEQQQSERAAARKEQQEKDRAAARKDQQQKERAAARKEQQEKDRAAAQKEQQQKERAAAQKEQQQKERAAARKEQQEKDRAAARKAQQQKERAAARKAQQQKERAAAQKQQAQPARHAEPARAAPDRKQGSGEQKGDDKSRNARKAKCADGKGDDCKRT